jgi:hypothetical protein
VTRGDIDLKTGMAMQIMFTSLRKIWKKFDADHIVLCLEGRSWRREIYKPYKRARRAQATAKSEKEKEEDELFYEALNDFLAFARERTNVTVLQNDILEADDLIAGWIDHHPDDFHVILSGDSDFYQLISNNVVMYDGVRNVTIKLDGVWDDKDKPVIDKKTKEQKQIREPEYELFLKCMRGDASDGVFSAYPKVRENKIQQAYDDRRKQGWAWNNIMLQEWVDSDGETHRVLDDYKRNRELIDLRAQPEPIRQLMSETIREGMARKNVKQTGIWFIKFCDEWDLQRLAKDAQMYGPMLQADYPEA